MFAASSRLRIAAALVASAWVSLVAVNGSAQTIDFSLNVFYANEFDSMSGGMWELVAKSSPGPATVGISGITANLRNINNDALIEGPRGLVNGSNIAGFQILSNTFHPPASPTPAYREIVVSQLPLIPLPSGSEENLFYGVGTLTKGYPNYPGKPLGSNFIGPAFTSLTNPQDIPWAELPDVFGDTAWNTAARMLSGTFATGVTPGFFAGTQGDVFTTLPTTNGLPIGNVVTAATGLTLVRTNLSPLISADYNQNGLVDAPDYVLWRKTLSSTAAPPGSGADGNHDGTVNPPDVALWRSHFGNPMGAGSGGGLSTSTVPEPTSCALLTIGALMILAPRRGRFQHPVNN